MLLGAELRKKSVVLCIHFVLTCMCVCVCVYVCVFTKSFTQENINRHSFIHCKIQMR